MNQLEDIKKHIFLTKKDKKFVNWLVRIIKQQSKLIKKGIDLPPSEYDYKWRMEAKILLSKIDKTIEIE